MSRKFISDDSGIIIAESLGRNKSIEHIDLTGNCLQSTSIQAFGEMLLINKSLKHINFELNNITDSNTNIDGVKALAEALKKNMTLIWLNLNSTCLNDKCS